LAKIGSGSWHTRMIYGVTPASALIRGILEDKRSGAWSRLATRISPMRSAWPRASQPFERIGRRRLKGSNGAG